MLSQHSSITATINTPMGIALSMPSDHGVRLLFTHLCPTDWTKIEQRWCNRFAYSLPTLRRENGVSWVWA